MVLKHSLFILKHGSLWTYRLATYAVLAAGIVFVALVIGLRYVVLPNINDYREAIAQAVSRAAGQRVSIGAITGSWQGYQPELSFQDVRVFDTRDQQALSLGRVEAVLSWLSLLDAEVRFESLEIVEPELEVRRDAAGELWLAGIAVERSQGRGGGFADWLLTQRQVLVRSAQIVWRDETRAAPDLRLTSVNIRLDSDGESHRFGLNASPPAEVASQIVARGELWGRSAHDLQAWRGRLYLEFGYADLAQAKTWIAVPFDVARGLGSLHVWMDLEGPGVAAATADLRLVNVQARLAPDLPELALANLQGRLAWNSRGGRTQISAQALGFTTADGLTLAPMQLSFTRTGTGDGGGHSELRLEKLDLAPVVELAEYLPLDASLRGRLGRSSPSGMVDEALFSWEGEWNAERPYRAHARFSGLTLKPDGVFPGFRGINGQFDADQGGGTVSLSARDAHVELPRVFSEEITLDVLTAEAGWKFQDGHTLVTLKNVAFTNAHLAGNVYGWYRTDPEGDRGSADLAGSMVRVDARQLWRYIPVFAPVTQAWLRRALLAGESRDVRFRLQGPLNDFPFENDKTGLFEVKTRVTGVTLDYADGWPPLTNAVADVVFRGRRMEVRPQAGSILGLRLSDVLASIPELGKHDEHLLVKGVAEGPTAEFLRFVESSPVSRHINRFTEDMKASGNARLDVELDLPLRQIADSVISGVLVLRDNQITVDPRLPPLEGFGARMAFTKKTVSVKDGRARLAGNPISFEASNQKDGGMVLNVAGTLDATRLRSVSNHPALQFVEGQTEWRGNIGVRDKMASLRIDSSLVGIGSTLPAPFAKAAGTSLPLHLELRERPGRQRLLAIDLGKVASARVLLDSADPDGIKRGMVSLGATASLPAADGLWVNGSLDVVDVDSWRPIFAGGSGSPSVDLAGADLQIGILDAHRRRFHDLRVNATRQDSAWQAALSGREIAGQLSWASAGEGRLSARLTRLTLPPLTTTLETGAADSFSSERRPSVDLVAESFTFEGKDLGQLTVLADPEPSGWRLQRLEITNPESKLSINGRWAVVVVSRTDVEVRLEVNDIGKFFSRVGWHEGVKGGSALLEGPVAWAGSPYRVDIPSLSGQLKLEAKNGRFRQIEPGVAKLLGILSLQALPRRASLDFQDVFSKGFTFDRISANLSIANGVVHTEDFMMEGSAARVGMRGRVDLAAETQNLIVRVTPSLSESIAVAGAIVNPAVGVAAYLAQKALKDPLSKIASFEYSVTGTWADPVVARINKPVESPPSRR
ncbi:MAG TPA: YhdP family protein [Burkholderiales bacterium]|nr:YhdP family protein [Burkholderiales bacterium]